MQGNTLFYNIWSVLASCNMGRQQAAY